MDTMFSAIKKWLLPGMQVKRWFALGFCGLLSFMLGMGIIIQVRGPHGVTMAVRIAEWMIAAVRLPVRPGAVGAALSLGGIFVCVFALYRLIYSLTSALDPQLAPSGLVDVIYQKRLLTQGHKIVVIGGGTGLSTMLRGLKRYSANITAIVTVADDGGSSGRLQRQLGILPPGDIRNCLVALADSEPQMTQLFQFRFRNSTRTPRRSGSKAEEIPETDIKTYGEGLRDHAFGNLLIAAMCSINNGDFEKAVRDTSRVLNIRGRVLPSTVQHVTLSAEMEDGSTIEGETLIAHSPLKINHVSLKPGDAQPSAGVLEAIAHADVIVVGPGSVYTSIIPNLLVQGVPEAMRTSKAIKVYVCNVMTQRGETEEYSALQHVKAIEDHARQRIFNYVLVNTRQPTHEMTEKYHKTGAVMVEPDLDRIKKAGYKPIGGDFISQTDVVRHDSSKLAEAIMRLLR
jgi:uncharacterized cofD-like protein